MATAIRLMGLIPRSHAIKTKDNRVAIPAADIDTNHLYNQRGTVHDVNGIARTLVGCNQHSGSGNEPKVAIPVLTPDRANKRQNGRRFKEDGEEAFSLTTQDRHGVAVNVTGYNATLKQGRGGVQTAIQLCARDAKGPSTTNQPMTLAAYLLSTKESDQKSEQKPTASPSERTEDLADTNRKEP